MVWDVGTDAHMKSDEFSEKFQVGHVESKHLYCRFWTFEQGSLSMKLIQHLQHGFPKMRLRGVKGQFRLFVLVWPSVPKWTMPWDFHSANHRFLNLIPKSRDMMRHNFILCPSKGIHEEHDGPYGSLDINTCCGQSKCMKASKAS